MKLKKCKKKLGGVGLSSHSEWERWSRKIRCSRLLTVHSEFKGRRPSPKRKEEEKEEREEEENREKMRKWKNKKEREEVREREGKKRVEKDDRHFAPSD